YWRPGLPKSDTVILRPIPIDTTRLTEARTGGVEIASDPPFQDIQRLRDAAEVVLSEKQGFRWDYMAFNQAKDPGANQSFRQAFNWGIAREAIQEALFFGPGPIASDPFPPGPPFHDPGSRPFPPDREKARRLVESPGLEPPLTLEVALDPDPVKQRV